MKAIGDFSEETAKKAIDEIFDFGNWLGSTARNNPVLKQVKDALHKSIGNSTMLASSPPETLGGMVLRTIMSTVEESDFDAIIKVLESAKSEHELKWILRRLVNDSIKDDPDGKWLQEGIKRLANFGSESEGYNKFEERVKEILNAKNIIIH
jgi:deoxyhypusine synthase